MISNHRLAIFRSNPISPNPRVEKAASVASRLGQVTVVGWDRTGKLDILQDRPGFTLELFSLPASFGSGIQNLPRLLSWEWFLIKWVARNGRKYTLFHACDFDTIFPALLGKIFFKIRVIYDICDFYADHVRNTPKWILKIVRILDRFAIQFADAVILVDEIRSDQLGSQRIRRLEFIYNSPIDINGCEPVSKPPGFRLAYIGMLQVERGLLELINVMKRHPDWRLDLAGFGGDEEKILVAAKSAAGINWHGRVNYEKAIGLSRTADVLIATYDPSVPNHLYSSPNKVFEAMMLGKPIVVAQGTHVDDIINQWHCGMVVPYGDREALENTLCTLATNESLRIELGLNSRRAYEEKYNWQIMAARLTNLYAGLIATG